MLLLLPLLLLLKHVGIRKFQHAYSTTLLLLLLAAGCRLLVLLAAAALLTLGNSSCASQFSRLPIRAPSCKFEWRQLYES